MRNLLKFHAAATRPGVEPASTKSYSDALHYVPVTQQYYLLPVDTLYGFGGDNALVEYLEQLHR